MQAQQTLKGAIHCTGVGLHSGAKVSMTLRPAAPDTGIVFLRADVPADRAEIRARWDMVVDTRLCTVIGNAHGITVGPIEHLMAALRGLGVDNCVVSLDGAEVPIMDGSAAPFVFLIECAGLIEQSATRKVVRVLKPVIVADGDKSAALRPAAQFSFGMEIDFASAAISHQRGQLRLAGGAFKAEVSRARTFGFLHEVEAMRKAGLARGGSLDNAVVVSGDRVLNEGGLRYRDEFVRHKILDAVGDLYLAGGAILGHFHGVKTGHALNNRLLHALFADAEAWTWDHGASLTGGERVDDEQRRLAYA